jgi:hypothetical protein
MPPKPLIEAQIWGLLLTTNKRGFSMMEAHQIRVVTENNELAEKLDKLQYFILSDKFDRLPQRQQKLLCRQNHIMNLYTDVLDERISLF